MEVAVAAGMDQEYASERMGESIFPIFLVIDTSGSMSGERIKAAGELVPAIQDVCLENPAVADMLRMGVITFNSRATVYMPFGKPEESAVPNLLVTGLTDFGAAFRLLRTEVENAIVSLRADGFRQIVRPTAFFITDGVPTDSAADRDKAFAELTDKSFRYSPNVFMFGVGAADLENLSKYRHRKGIAAVAKDTLDAAEGLRKLIPAITQSIVASVSSVNDTTGNAQTIFDVDDLDDDFVFLDD